MEGVTASQRAPRLSMVQRFPTGNWDIAFFVRSPGQHRVATRAIDALLGHRLNLRSRALEVFILSIAIELGCI